MLHAFIGDETTEKGDSINAGNMLFPIPSDVTRVPASVSLRDQQLTNLAMMIKQ